MRYDVGFYSSTKHYVHVVNFVHAFYASALHVSQNCLKRNIFELIACPFLSLRKQVSLDKINGASLATLVDGLC